MKTSFVLLLSLLTLVAQAQTSEKFKGQNWFEQCEEPVAIDFGKLESAVFSKTIRALDNVEIVWLQPISKGRARYEFCYLVADEVNGVGLVPAEVFQDASLSNRKIYPLEVENHLFYRADCFREILGKHPELDKFLREQ